tara:strand:- start:418 stop:678 length:261 start_codon:yes stop_codon:yes gene_type:complete
MTDFIQIGEFTINRTAIRFLGGVKEDRKSYGSYYFLVRYISSNAIETIFRFKTKSEADMAHEEAEANLLGLTPGIVRKYKEALAKK